MGHDLEYAEAIQESLEELETEDARRVNSFISFTEEPSKTYGSYIRANKIYLCPGRTVAYDRQATIS